MKTFNLILLFVLFASLVSSEGLCPRDTDLFTDIVVNGGSEIAQYTVNLKGSASGWATAVPNGFTLNPGERKTVYTYVTPSKNAIPATYDLTTVVSGSETPLNFVHPIIVKNCFGATLDFSEDTKNSCPMEVAKYEFSLTNTGEYRTTYQLNVEGELKEAVTLGDRVVSLDSKETKKIIAYVNVPIETNTFDFTVVAKSDKVTESFVGHLNVLPCYKFNVGIEKNAYDFCERTVVEIPVKIKNEGTIKNGYDLEISGIDWVVLSDTYIELEPNQEKIVVLTLAPDYGISGELNLHLEVIPKKGAFKAMNDFRINVRKCNSVDVNIIESTGMLCSGMSSGFDVNIKNNGELDKEFRIEFTGPAWLNLGNQDDVFNLKSGETKELTLRADPNTDEESGKYQAKLKVSATDESSVSAFSEDSLDLTLVDVESCFLPTIETENDAIKVYKDGTATIPFAVQNKGKTKADYNVVISGSASSFAQLSPAAITVEPGNTEIVYLYIAPVEIEVGEYDTTVSVRLKDSTFLASQDLNIEVTDTEIPTEEVLVKNSLWSRVKTALTKGWYLTVWNKVKDFKYYILGGIIFLLLILILWKVGSFKKVKDFFEEEIDEK